MNFSFENIINETIEEYVDNISLQSDGNLNRSLPTVYQCAKRDRIKSIFKNGYSREYFASAGGNFYTSAVYTTFNLQSSIRNSYVHADDYGDVIIKIGLKSFDRFLILNKKIAQQVYGKNYLPQDQLEILFSHNPKLLQRIKNSSFYQQIIQTYDKFTSNNVQALLYSLNGMRTQSDGDMIDNNIAGFVFHGGNDGDVAIIHDPKSIIPLAYSLDHGQTWQTDLLTQQTLDNSSNDYDPLIFLGSDAKKYVNPQNYRFLNDFWVVQRKQDNKYNFMDNKKNILFNEVWFDNASKFDTKGKAMVQLGDIIFYVDKDKDVYEKQNDKYPIMDINEFLEELKNI